MIYMDNAATTRVWPEVRQAVIPFLEETYGNPSGVHDAGRQARKACEHARRCIAAYLGADAGEIYFTSGGSEADSWAIIGSAFAPGNQKRTFITTAIEHKAVLNAAAFLEKQGFHVKYLPVDTKGRVDMEALKNEINADTFLVSVMAANNEVGTLQEIDTACEIAHSAGARFHTDAVQAVTSREWDLHRQKYDFLSLSGHKLHAPKGTGVLYIKEGVHVSPLIFGGAQERGKRGGTENICGIVGLGRAFELFKTKCDGARVAALRDRLEAGVLARIEGVQRNGDPQNRLAGTTNLSFDGVEGEALLLSLDLKRIAVSAGSACTSGSMDPSHVLMSMGLCAQRAQSSVRFSLSEDNTPEEVDTVLDVLAETVERLRKMNSAYKERRL